VLNRYPRDKKVETCGSYSIKWLRQLRAQGIGAYRYCPEGDAGDNAVNLAEEERGYCLDPSEDSITEKRAIAFGIEEWR
jgi:hypothetical protein